jgi:hypothetical protein
MKRISTLIWRQVSSVNPFKTSDMADDIPEGPNTQQEFNKEYQFLVPAWLWKTQPQYGNGQPEITTQFIDELANSRNEMYKSLELVHTHIQGVLTTCFTLIAASGIVLANGTLGSGELIDDPVIHGILSGFALIIIGIFVPIHCVNSKRIIRLYYNIYVSSIIHVISWHLKFNCAHCHGWIVENIRIATRYDNEYSNRSKEDNNLTRLEYFINRRVNDPQFSYVLYARLFNWIAFVSACAGLALAFYKISLFVDI